MEILEEVQGLYEAYREQVRRLERTRKPWDGILGFGGGPQNHPCHEQFAASLEQVLQAGTARPLSPETARALLDYICFPPLDRQDSSYWMLLAVHSLTLDLIALLDPADAQALHGRYQAVYPRRSLLPAQKKVLDALARQAAHI